MFMYGMYVSILHKSANFYLVGDSDQRNYSTGNFQLITNQAEHWGFMIYYLGF